MQTNNLDAWIDYECGIYALHLSVNMLQSALPKGLLKSSEYRVRGTVMQIYV